MCCVCQQPRSVLIATLLLVAFVSYAVVVPYAMIQIARPLDMVVGLLVMQSDSYVQYLHCQYI